MRIDGQTQPAPHHYVEALIRRVKFPLFEGFVKFGSLSANGEKCLIDFEVFLFNWSPVINVKSPILRLMCNPGVIGTKDSADCVVSLPTNLLHFGAPIRHKDFILIKNFEIPNDGYIELSVIFGADNTPLKTSEYTVRLPIPVRPAYLDKYVSKRVENVLFKDLQDKRGETRESILRTVLERSPNQI